jgi:hypothetical protein
MSLRFLSVLLLLVISGCEQSDSFKEKASHEIDEIINGSEVSISSFLYKPRNILLTKDYLIIYDDVEQNMLKVFSYPEIDFLFEWGIKGRGPEEIRTIIKIANGLVPVTNEFYLLDFFTVKKLEIKESNRIVTNKRFELNKDRGLINGFCVLNDSLFMGDAFDGVNADYEHIFLYPDEKKGKKFGQYPKEDLSFDQPINKAIYYNKTAVANPIQKKIVSFYYNLHKVKLYNYDGELLKEIDVESGSKTNSEERAIVFAAPSITKNHIYVLYINENREDFIKDPGSFTPEILVFDWDGEIVDRYLLDKSISSFAVSEKHGKIYGIDFEGGNKIFEFDLPALDKKISEFDSELFETDFYQVDIPTNWILPPNIKDKNRVFDRKVDYNKNAFIYEKSADLPCGASIAIEVFFPEDTDNAYDNIYGTYFNESATNFASRIDAINGKSLPCYYFEKNHIHPDPKNNAKLATKNTGWLWQEQDKIIHIRFTACKEYEENFEKARQVVASFRMKNSDN